MIFKRAHLKASSIATGWTGVDMSTPLLLDVAPEIDTNPTSFYRGRGGWSLRLQTPVIGSGSALAMSVHPTYFDLATPLLKALSIICVLASLTGLTKFCRCKLVYSFVRVRLTIETQRGKFKQAIKAIHPSVFLYRISKISHYAYCFNCYS